MASPQSCGGGGSHRRCIQPMGFWQSLPLSVPFGPSTAACFDWQPGGTQVLIESPPRTIDRCHIRERRLRLCCDLWMSKFFGCSVCFGLVTVMATEHEITHTLTAPTTFREHMIQFKGNLFALAICTPILPFCQDIFTDLHPEKGSALIGTTVDFWILQCLWIKVNQFLADRPNGTPAFQSLDPGHHLKHTAEQRRSQPTSRSSSIGPASRSIAGVPHASGTAYGPAFAQSLPNLLAAVGQFCCPDQFAALIVHQCQSRHLGARIDFETQRLNDCLSSRFL